MTVLLGFICVGLLITLAILFVDYFKEVRQLAKELTKNENLQAENEELHLQCDVYRRERQNLEKEKNELVANCKRLKFWQPIVDVEKKIQELMLEAERERTAVLYKTDQEKQKILDKAELKKQDILSFAEREKLRILQITEQEKRLILQAAEQEKQQLDNNIEHAKAMLEATQQAINEKNSELDLACKMYRHRKTLPDQYRTLKRRFDQLQKDYRNLKSTDKGSSPDTKERKKLLSQFEKLGLAYINDTLKYVVSKMTPNNYTFSRDRVLNRIKKCREIGFDWPDEIEKEYIEKVQEEFERVCRLEEARLEQQRIKERIREEEKVKREIELLKKKEEQQLKEQEMTKQARRELERAIAKELEATHGIHTAQTLKMTQALAEKDQIIAAQQQAIEDSQRAISNAEKGIKAGHVYVLSNIGSFGNDVYKIGMTRRDDPQIRVNELSSSPVPFPFDVHMMISCDNAPELENALHKAFYVNRVNRVNNRKEFFHVDINEVKKCVERITGKPVDYIVDPAIFDSYAEQYWESQNTTPEDRQYVETIFEKYHLMDDDSDDE